MKTFFARHSGDLDVSNDTLRRLREEGVTAIHYPWGLEFLDGQPDALSLDPNSYGPAAKGALAALLELGRDGGYVCATYRDTDSAFIGRVSPGTPVELRRERWASDETREAVLKSLKVGNWIEVPPGMQKLLLALAPQQSTFSRWHKVGSKVADLVEGRDPGRGLDSLHTLHQEVMCAEFLRIHGLPGVPRLAHLLMPVGRTLKEFDIVGLTSDGELLLAQVTFGNDERKLERFKSIARQSNGRHVYFCDAAEVRHEENVTIIPLRLAHREFSTSPLGERWLSMVHASL